MHTACTVLSTSALLVSVRLTQLEQTTQDVDAVTLLVRTPICNLITTCRPKLQLCCVPNNISNRQKPFGPIDHGTSPASNLFPDKMCQESNMSSCRGAAVSRHLATRLSEHVRVLERGHNTRKRWNQNILFGTFSTWVCLIVGTPSTNTSGGGAVLSNDMIKVNLRETHTEEALSGHQRYITHWACLKASPWCLLTYNECSITHNLLLCCALYFGWRSHS